MKRKVFLISTILIIIILLFDFYLYDSWLYLTQYTFSGDFTNKVLWGGGLTLLLLCYILYKLYLVFKKNRYINCVEKWIIIMLIPLIYMYLFESCIYLNRDFGIVGLNYLIIPLGFIGYVALPYTVSILVIKKIGYVLPPKVTE